jgi:hypothetical protein
VFFGGIDFVFAAIGFSIVVRAVRGDRGRRYRFDQPQPPVTLQDPRVAQLQAEVEDLRNQVERLNAAESFYAQLNAPAPPSSAQPPPLPPRAGG